MKRYFGMLLASLLAVSALSSLTAPPRSADAGAPQLPPIKATTKSAAAAMAGSKNGLVAETDSPYLRRYDGTTVGGFYVGGSPQKHLFERLRRAAQRAAVSNLIDAGAMASPPTVTSAGTDSQAVVYSMSTSGVLQNMDKVNLIGGVPFSATAAPYNGSYAAVKSVSSTSGSNIGTIVGYQNAWYVETMTDSPNLSCRVFRTAESGVMVAVSTAGGPFQYTQTTPVSLFNNGSACGANLACVTVAFGSSAPRRVRFEFGNTQADETCGGSGGVAALNRLTVDTGYTIWKPQDVDVINAAIIGDSYTAGAPRDAGMQSVNWAKTLASKMGWRPVQMALGGTGYSKANTVLPPCSDPLRLADLTAQPYDVFVFAMGTNDVSGNDGTAAALPDIQSKALTCFQAARTANANAPIFVLGPWPRTSFPLQTQLDCATAVQAAVTQFADANTYFIPIYNDTAGNWMPGTGYQGATNNDVSSRYIWTDHIHPILSGHYYYGERTTLKIRGIIQSAYAY